MDHTQVPEEELRLALVLNGGVSLAVWMGGVAHELQRLTNQTGPYQGILALARARVVVDVISGTSAGGINGAALALAQVNSKADLGQLRDLWSERGRIEALLRPPFQGQPNSLLQGDEYFLPALNQAMRGLMTPFERRQDNLGEPTEVDLTITTTLLTGFEQITTDDLGQQLPQRIHGGHFHFRFEGENCCSAQQAQRVADALALASLSTASFPVAFEPSFLPVNDPESATRLRPDMAEYVSWRDLPGTQSRFAVDGGVLANTPTKQALEAIDRRPAHGLVRRAMLLVFPHAPDPDPPAADRPDEPPTALGTLNGVLTALRSQGSRTYVDELTEYNRRAADWRGGRRQVLNTVGLDLQALYDLVSPAWRHYRHLRIRRAAHDLARRHLADQAEFNASAATATGSINSASFEQLRRDANAAQLSVPVTALPYVPEHAPPALDAQQGWRWGFNTASGIADGIAEVTRAALRIATVEQAEVLAPVLSTVSAQRRVIIETREALDGFWLATPERLNLKPDTTYWTARLQAYQLAMLGSVGSPTEALTRVLPADDVAHVLTWDGASGAQVSTAVTTMLSSLIAALPTVQTLSQSPAGTQNDVLQSWSRLLTAPALDGEATDEATRLLQRFLALDVATWLVGDGPATGTALPLTLMQLSLQMWHPWATYSTTPDDKAAGMSLARFGGFLKRSWRMNDWAWGRLDAIALLARATLEPRRLREIGTVRLSAAAADAAQPPATASALADELLESLTQALYGEEPLPDQVRSWRELAQAELTQALDPQAPLPSSCAYLAAYAAYPLQARAISEELLTIARAIEVDQLEGGNTRGASARFLTEQADLLEELKPPQTPGWLDRGSRALRAFDRAGLGREELSEESSSDAMIRTIAKTSGSLVTLLDSPRSGAAKLRPVTGVLRGAFLLPYWLINGLTGAGAAARFLATLGLVGGGMLLALSMFGVLGDLAPTAAAVGTGTVLAGMAYAAFRSGTLLHACALLAPVVPLLAYAFDVNPGQSAGQAASRALGVLSLAAVLYLLARLPWPRRTPFAWLGDWWRSTLRDPRPALLGLGLAGVAAWIVLADWPRDQWRKLDAWWPPDEPIFIAASVGLIAVAGLIAYVGGKQFRVWWSLDGAELPTSQGHLLGTFERRRLEASSGVAAAWAPVYGLAYLALAWGFWLIAKEPGKPRLDAFWVEFTWWWFGGLATLLCLVTPVVLLVQVYRSARGRLTTSGFTISANTPHAQEQQLLAGLLKYQVSYRIFVRSVDLGGGGQSDALKLTAAGRRLISSFTA